MAKRWTEDEVNFLKINSEKHEVNWIAKKLGRDQFQVRMKMKYENIPLFKDCTELLSAKDTAEIIGIDYTTLLKAVKSGKVIPDKQIRRKGSKKCASYFKEKNLKNLKNEFRNPGIKFTDYERRLIRDMYLSGKSKTEISNRINRSFKSVHSAIAAMQKRGELYK